MSAFFPDRSALLLVRLIGKSYIELPEKSSICLLFVCRLLMFSTCVADYNNDTSMTD